MGSFTKSYNGSVCAWTNTFTYPDEVYVSDETFLFSQVRPSIQSYRAFRVSGTWSSQLVGRAQAWARPSSPSTARQTQYSSQPYSQSYDAGWANKATKALSYIGGSDYVSNTSDYFNSSNPTERRVQLSIAHTGEAYFIDNYYQLSDSASYGWTTSNIGYIVLDVPPTFTYGPMTFDTSFDAPYAGLTTASVDVSDITAYYGGYITEANLTIGNQTAVLTGDNVDILSSGTLSILLDSVGTFAPTITVTDSRGQTKTETLSDITVLGYVNPSVSLAVERTLATGVPNDEGTYAVVSAAFTFTDAIATLSQPTVTGGTSAVWYKTRATSGALSNPVDWSDTSAIASGDTLYGLIGTFAPNDSYVISVQPNDSQGTGTAQSVILPTAFFTIDFLAGGHGIAFGKPATKQDVFECDLEAEFNGNVQADGNVQAGGNLQGANALLELDTSAATGVDFEITDALTTLGWDTDCIV